MLLNQSNIGRDFSRKPIYIRPPVPSSNKDKNDLPILVFREYSLKNLDFTLVSLNIC